MIFKLQNTKQLMLDFKKTWSFSTIIFCLFFSASSSLKSAEQSLDGIAAIVNSDAIMVSELRAATKQVQSARNNNLSQQELSKQVLEKLIMDNFEKQACDL